MQGRIFLGDKSDSKRQYVFGGRDRGDETVLIIRTVRDKRYRYLRNKYPEKPFLQLNRYKENSYPIIGLLRDLHSQGKLSGPSAVLMAPSRPREELYDLNEDPWEIHNLIHSPDHTEIKARLSKTLDNWIKRIDDKGQTPESKEITDYWGKNAGGRRDKELAARPKDWYLTAPALGPYKIEQVKN